MGKKVTASLPLPMRGYYRGSSYEQTIPGTTPSCIDVVPRSFQGRSMISQRAGTSKTSYTQLGSGNPIRGFWSCDVARTDNACYFSDEFGGTAVPAYWGGLPQYFATETNMNIDQERGQAYATAAGLAGCAGVITPADLAPVADMTQDWEVSIEVIPKDNNYGGVFKLFGLQGSAYGDWLGFIFSVTCSSTAGVATYTSQLQTQGDNLGVVTVTNYTWASGTTTTVKPGVLTVKYTVSTRTVRGYWQGALLGTQVIPAYTYGTKAGFGMNATGTATVYADNFLFQYTCTQVGTQSRPRRLQLCTSNGTAYRETVFGTWAAVGGSLTLAADRRINAADWVQNLYIADRGPTIATVTNGTTNAGGTTLDSATYADWTALGVSAAVIQNDYVANITGSTGGTAVTAGNYAITTCAAGNLTIATSCGGDGTTTGISFTLKRAPKQYSDSSGSMTLIAVAAGYANPGIIPLDCECVCIYRDRLVFAGDGTGSWYMSRRRIPYDFYYSAASTDEDRAVGSVSAADRIASPVKALFPFLNDYLIYGCVDSMWILRGDPASGGVIDNLSNKLGIISSGAGCIDAKGGLYFLSRMGLGYVPPNSTGPSASGAPILLSDGEDGPGSNPMPLELKDVDTGITEVSMAYDVQNNRVHIVLAESSKRNTKHFIYDVATRSFWPYTTVSAQDAFCLMSYTGLYAPSSGVIMGCRDGYTRKFHRYANNDDGTAIASNIYFAPVQFGTNGWSDGMIISLKAYIPSWSSPVDFTVYPRGSAEEAATANSTPSISGTFPKNNVTTAPVEQNIRMSGNNLVVKLSNSTNYSHYNWGIEGLSALLEYHREARPL